MLRYHSGEQNAYATNDHFPPISRTMRYKKVTKPLLERKRRARMNKCLDELKDLVCAMEADGENINKLEKADILELTVRHLKRISRLQDPVQEAHRFQAGFSQCAHEVCSFLVSLPGLNSAVGHRLIDHLKQCISRHRSPYPYPAVEHRQSVSSSKPLQVTVVSSQRFSPPLSPSTAVSNFKQNDKRPSNITSSCSNDSSRNFSKMANDANERGVSPSNSDGINPMWRPW